MLGVLGRKKKRLSSAQFQLNGLSFGRLACNIISKHLREGKKKKKGGKLKKGLPSSVLYISTHHF